MAQKEHEYLLLYNNICKENGKKLTNDFIISSTESFEKHSSIIDFLKISKGYCREYNAIYWWTVRTKTEKQITDHW